MMLVLVPAADVPDVFNQPPKKNRTYLQKDAKFQHIVSTYHRYKNNNTAYLDKLAEL